jgi:predicted DNA-binding protein (MmcQ/YjbR family)
MAVDWVRQLCLSFPHATENVQWGDDLVFKIAGKMFVVLKLEAGGNWLAFKSRPKNSRSWWSGLVLSRRPIWLGRIG